MSRCSILNVLRAAVKMCYIFLVIIFIAIIQSKTVDSLETSFRFKTVLENFGKNGHILVHNTHSFKKNIHWIEIDYSLAYDSKMKEAEINAIQACYAVINLYSGVK